MDIVTNEAVVLHMERLVMLATGLTILQVYARLKKREVHAVDQEGASDEQAFLICALSTYVQKCMQRRKWRFELSTKRGPLETSDFGKIGENHQRAGDNGENCPVPWRLAILMKMAIVAKMAISAKTTRGLVISRNVANIQIGCQKWPLRIR